MAFKRAFADRLPALLLVYGAASLLHHAHNALYLDTYPNMPPTLSVARVWAAWLVVAALGLGGYLLHRRYRVAGLIGLAAYGVLGLGGLLHYRLAPFSAHTWDMNLTIVLEAATALLALAAVSFLTFATKDRLGSVN